MTIKKDNRNDYENQKPIVLDLSWDLVYKTGGLSLIGGGAVLIIFLISIFVFRISLPLEPQAVLENPVAPVALYLLAAFGESLLMPGALAAFLAFRGINKNRALLGATLWLMASLMFLVSRGQIISLYLMSSKYLAATSVTLQTAYLVSADSVIEVANMYGNMSLVLFQSGSILIGSIVKKVFSKRTGNLVMISASMTIIGTLGVLFMPLAFFTLFGLIMTAVWQILVGRRLLKLTTSNNEKVSEP